MIRLRPMSPQPVERNDWWIWHERRPTTRTWRVRWTSERCVTCAEYDPPGPGPCVRVVRRCGVWWWVYRAGKLGADGRGER